jgi:hypothetical protein
MKFSWAIKIDPYQCISELHIGNKFATHTHNYLMKPDGVTHYESAMSKIELSVAN